MTSRSKLSDAAQATSDKVAQFQRYWRGKAGEGQIPSRAVIDPTEIPRLLPYLVMAEVEAQPMRVRYRLVGTRLVEANGADYTNRYLDECNFAIEPLLVECYRRLVATRAPVFAHYEWNKSNWGKSTGGIGACQTGFFPLSSDGSTIDFVISIADSQVRPCRQDAT